MGLIGVDRPVSRRLFLKGSALIGCSAAAHPFMTTMTLAAAPWDQRLVVVILRGAMDGLDVVRPVGDPAFAAFRPTLGAGDPVLALDNFYALHPALAPLMPLWAKGELGFAHAVSTPYRDKRSHFDGQDILEAGTGLDVPEPSVRDGWLNRMLQSLPGLTSQTAFAIGRDEMKVLLGAAPYGGWAPDARLKLSAQSRNLLEAMYHDDPLFQRSVTEAMNITDHLATEAMASADKVPAMQGGMSGAMNGGMAGDMGGGMAGGMADGKAPAADDPQKPDPLASFAASRLREDTRIAAFSISGWDTHHAQIMVLGKQLRTLANTILTLRNELGDVWKKTTVLAMTEFGRTARENGTGGTDHGTGGVMVMAGGAVRGGKVYGKFPGLADGALYQDRDLMPTADVRSYAAWAMRGLYGIDKGVLAQKVFPALDMGSDPGIIA